MLEKIVAEMPKAENPYQEILATWSAFKEGSEAQCQLLAEQGYRKLRTQYEIVDWLRQKFPVLEEVCSIELLAQELHRRLLGV